jgi:hypothetical protein
LSGFTVYPTAAKDDVITTRATPAARAVASTRSAPSRAGRMTLRQNALRGLRAVAPVATGLVTGDRSEKADLLVVAQGGFPEARPVRHLLDGQIRGVLSAHCHAASLRHLQALEVNSEHG